MQTTLCYAFLCGREFMWCYVSKCFLYNVMQFYADGEILCIFMRRRSDGTQHLSGWAENLMHTYADAHLCISYAGGSLCYFHAWHELYNCYASQYLCYYYASYSLCIMLDFMHTLCIRRPMKFYASDQIVCAFMQVLCSRRAMHVMHFMCPPKKFLCSFMRFYACIK
jgi:hypothetical protein